MPAFFTAHSARSLRRASWAHKDGMFGNTPLWRKDDGLWSLVPYLGGFSMFPNGLCSAYLGLFFWTLLAIVLGSEAMEGQMGMAQKGPLLDLCEVKVNEEKKKETNKLTDWLYNILAWFIVCLFTSLLAYLFACSLASLLTCLQTYWLTTHSLTWLLACLLACSLACLLNHSSWLINQQSRLASFMANFAHA